MTVNPQSKEASLNQCIACQAMFPDDEYIHCKAEAIKILKDFIESKNNFNSKTSYELFRDSSEKDMAFAALEYLEELLK